MLIRPRDAATSEREVWDFVRAAGFGHLVAAGRGRDVPVVVPTQYVVDGDGGAARPTVLLHLTRDNPVWAAVAESPIVLLSVAGDWAYIPSSWKALPHEDASLGIPTTYYAAAQLVGRAEPVDDPDELLDVLRRQLDALQPDGGHADPSVHRQRLRAIRGMRLTVDDVRGKFKYGGNVDVEHRLAVADRLAQRDGPGDAAARRHLLRRSGQDT
jgi:transcriptional regulator